MRYLLLRNKSMEAKSQVHIFQKLMTVMCLRYRQQAQLITFVFFFLMIQTLGKTLHNRSYPILGLDDSQVEPIRENRTRAI